MHHVPYTHRLRSGQTVIQHIYDRHFAGAAEAADFARRWRALAGRIDQPRFDEVLRRLEYQAGHAEEWRDAIDAFFFRKSGIADDKKRIGAGQPPGRIEAEAMALQGYAPVEVTPAEAASGGRAIRCAAAQPSCVAGFRYAGAAGWFDVGVRYFDQSGGVARFTLRVAGQLVDEWRADDDLPSSKFDAHTSTRRLLTGVALRPGDEIRVEASADAGDAAALDYVEVTPAAARPDAAVRPGAR
jgi:alpha-glucuronidase